MPNLGLIRDFISEKMRATLGGNRVKYRATSQTEVLLDVGFHGRLTKASSAIAAYRLAYRTGDGTKTDEFSEKFQTASDLPPFIFRNLCCKIVFYSLYFLRFSVISEIYPSQRGAATEIKC